MTLSLNVCVFAFVGFMIEWGLIYVLVSTNLVNQLLRTETSGTGYVVTVLHIGTERSVFVLPNYVRDKLSTYAINQLLYQ